jgi:hypothetical protein
MKNHARLLLAGLAVLAVAAIASAQSVGIAIKKDTTLTGTGSSGSPLGVDTSIIQARVDGTCGAGSAVTAVAADGSVTCGTAGSTYTAGDGLTLTGSDFDVGCGANMTCAADTVSLSTSVTDLVYLETQELSLAPPLEWSGDPNANLAVLELDDWAPTGLQTSTLIVTRGADNEGTRITGIDSTNINPGDVRFFVNLPGGSTPPTDSGTITFVHESTDSLAANRIQTPGKYECTFPMYSVIGLIYGGDDADGNDRWRLISDCGWTQQVKTQALSFYPLCAVGSQVSPISGTYNNFRPTCTTQFTAGYLVAGSTTDSWDHTMLQVYTDAAGATITGLYTSGSLADPNALGITKVIRNMGPGTLTLKHLVAGSDVENRFNMPQSEDIILGLNEAAWLYTPLRNSIDGNSQWFVMSVGHSNTTFPSVTTTGRVNVGGQFDLTGVETPAALAAGVTNNYDPGSRDAVWRLTGHASGSQLTGIVAPALTHGEVHLLVNIGSGPLVLVTDDGAASTAENRFLLDAAAVVIPANGVRLIRYDLVDSRWRIASTGGETRMSLPHSIDTASTSGTQQNYAPTGCKYTTTIRVVMSGATTLGGLSCGQADGDVKVLIASGNTLSLTALDAGSSAGNKFQTPRSATVTVGTAGAFIVRYNTANQVWDVVSWTGSATPVEYSTATADSLLRFTNTTGTVGPAAITDNGTTTLTIGTGRTTTMAGVTIFGSSASATAALFAIQAPAWTNRLVPTALTSSSTTDNWAPTNFATFEHIAVTTSGAGAATLAGMTAGSNGQLKTLCNFGSGPLKLTNEAASSTAGNRMTLQDGVDTTLLDGTTGKMPCVSFRYDANNARWEERSRNFDGTNMAAPSAGTCGTGPTFSTNSHNEAFTLTTGTGATACTITFGDGGYTNMPTCVVSAQSGTQPVYTVSTTALTMSTAAASAVYHVFCGGH